MTTKPINVQFDPEARVRLEKLKAETGAEDLATVVQRALGLYEWALEKRRQGYNVGCYQGDDIIEVVLDGYPTETTP